VLQLNQHLAKASVANLEWIQKCPRQCPLGRTSSTLTVNPSGTDRYGVSYHSSREAPSWEPRRCFSHQVPGSNINNHPFRKWVNGNSFLIDI
jgi:hypothetical protein